MTFRIVAFLLMLGVRTSAAYEVEPLTEKGLMGRWEGAGRLGLTEWVRMDLFPGGGYLAIVRGGPPQDLFKLEKLRITGRNKVSLQFREISGPPLRFPVILSVDAIAFTFEDTIGEFNATMVQSLSKAHWTFDNIYLKKGKEPSQDLIRMLKNADRMIRDAKRKRL